MADYLAVLFGSGTARVIALANNVLIARYLGIEKFGQFSLFYIVMLFAWIIPQAIDTTFVKFAKGHKTAGQTPSYWRANVQLKMFYCTLMALFAWPAGQLLAKELFHKPQTSWLLSLGLLCGSFLSIMNSVASSFQVREKFGRFAIMQALYAVIVCLGLLIVFLFTAVREVAPVIYLYVAVSATTGSISMIILLRATPNYWKIEPAILNQVIHFGKWIFFTAIAFYTFPRIDGMVLARYLDLSKLGIYSVATQLTMIISVVTGSMSAVFLPRAMQALNSTETLTDYLKDAVRPIAIILASIIFLELGAPLLIKLIYGHQYEAAVWPLRILLTGYIFSSLYLPLSFLYYTMELPHIRFYLETGKMVLVLILFSQLIPIWGLAGAAMSMATAMAVNCLLAGGFLFSLLRKQMIHGKISSHF